MNTVEISNRLIQEIEEATDSVFIELEKINNLYDVLNNVGLDDEEIDLVLKGVLVNANSETLKKKTDLWAYWKRKKSAVKEKITMFVIAVMRAPS